MAMDPWKTGEENDAEYVWAWREFVRSMTNSLNVLLPFLSSKSHDAGANAAPGRHRTRAGHMVSSTSCSTIIRVTGCVPSLS